MYSSHLIKAVLSYKASKQFPKSCSGRLIILEVQWRTTLQTQKLFILVLQPIKQQHKRQHKPHIFSRKYSINSKFSLPITRKSLQSVTKLSMALIFSILLTSTAIRLWSIQYARNGIKSYIRGSMVTISQDFEKKEDHMILMINFLLDIKI
ncbi:uncharacterized protein EV154DRAFT_554362 [Mucor mucedo]|uniref:uncharacterized protein n=1 Tax=Mucor mucedo TaxID=29922 RepID=UPI0022208068|nr:uncharacterized protein EV154DRAFT_554362 [Mucor mucedo]KAI7887749.1 hypothetical protein EV154DRAFT_554362 [Mucor mucedo]